jgi:hypothetical protein
MAAKKILKIIMPDIELITRGPKLSTDKEISTILTGF